jgi:D-alanyl-lipoteichoic acid acyltransferase DltB (MBOAT superfamily)
MVFNSTLFFITLAPFLLFYFSGRTRRSAVKKTGLLIYSYFFYGMWNPVFLLLIMISTITDYLAALGIVAYPGRKKVFITGSLVINLGLLGFFKYYNFFADTMALLLNSIGIEWSPSLTKILLPVGISFYTFQTLSYTIEVYRGRISAENNLLDVAVFVAFFPQLVAGPIVRASDFLPQLVKEPPICQNKIADGIFFILAGLFLKDVIADNIAPNVNYLFQNWKSNAIMDNWIAGMLFGVQIYGDFNGYSLIAIGLGRILGFDIQQNFDAPYGAAGFADFWRKWHISLSTWLRDYLYISLGGNRRGTARTYWNLMITMLIGGLWHGVNFMFIIWGGLHGVYLCGERLIRRVAHISFGNRAVQRMFLALGIVFTYLTVSITWIPFRAESAEQGIEMMKGLFWGNFDFQNSCLFDCVIIVVVFLCQCVSRHYDFFVLVERNNTLRFTAVTVILFCLYFFSGKRTDFIYFQF